MCITASVTLVFQTLPSSHRIISFIACLRTQRWGGCACFCAPEVSSRHWVLAHIHSRPRLSGCGMLTSLFKFPEATDQRQCCVPWLQTSKYSPLSNLQGGIYFLLCLPPPCSGFSLPLYCFRWLISSCAHMMANWPRYSILHSVTCIFQSGPWLAGSREEES